MIGPPGTGKSMLAQRLPGLLPPLSEDEALAVAAIASLAGRFSPNAWGVRPFRAPHHTASAVALVGGGSDPRPGEISLAHHGVLFLDELPEWDRRVLEVLREPLESGVIHISRAARQSIFPAEFQFIAAMNPCPCGWLGHASGRCHCTPDRIARYRGRISGPLIDRIDLGIEVPAVAADALGIGMKAVAAESENATTSGDVRVQVTAARERQIGTSAQAERAPRTTRSRSALCARREGRGASRACNGSAVVISARVSPDSQSRADDRRSCRQREHRRAARGRGRCVSAI